MRPVRSALIALGAAGALVLSFTGVADAQEPYIVNTTATCNTATGEYDLLTQFNGNTDGVDVENIEVFWEDDASNEGTIPLDDFTLNSGDEHELTYSVPGTATLVEVTFDLPTLDDNDFDSIDLDGTCVAAVTTTEAPTTTAAPTSTTAAAVDAVAATPAYTG